MRETELRKGANRLQPVTSSDATSGLREPCTACLAHGVDTKPRLALALGLYTVQRRGDVIRMGRQHINNGVIHVRQEKTGTTLRIPLHPALQAVLEATRTEHLTVRLHFAERCRDEFRGQGGN